MGELIMKTNRIITMLAVAAAAMACNQAEIESPSALKANQFMASAPSTKVSMNADFSLYWEAGDQVSVFAPDGSNNLFTSEAETGAKATVLNGAESFTIDLSQTYYAIYPYSADNSIENGVITTTIPTVQTPVKGAFPVNHAVAVSDGQNLSFLNVCGLFGFNITQEDIVSVTIKAKGAEEYLTGKVAVGCADASYTVVDGLTEVTLVTKDKFAVGTYYVAVLPQTFSGMTVTMFKADGSVASVTNTAGFRLDRSHRLETGVIDGGTFAGKITTITNAAELQGFLAAADSYSAEDEVTVANDIDLSGYELVPATSFAGTFDGQSNKITNWNTKTALFNAVSGTVKDLTIDETCSLEVQPTGNAAFITLANSGTISDCVNNGIVTSVSESFTSKEARMVGTIAAVSTGKITSCTNNGAMTLNPKSVNMAATQYIGGLVGQASGASETVEFISDCTNNGALRFTPESFSCKLFIGGVCGGTPAGAGTFGEYGVIRASKNLATVTLSSSVMSSKDTYINMGGVVGYAESNLEGCDNEGTVTVDLPKTPESENYNYQRPAVGGVAGAVLYNVTECSNAGVLSVTGAFCSTSGGNVGDGKDGYASFGGVVGTAGSNATSHKITSCTNSGRISLDIDMFNTAKSHGNIGGVVGNAIAQVISCSSEGEGMVIKNKMRGARVGGVVGVTNAALSGASNSAPIDYDMVIKEKNGNQCEYIYLGGVLGYSSSSATTVVSSSVNTGNITVSNGYNSGVASAVGGLAGRVTYGTVDGSINNAKSSVRGTYTLNTSAMVYYGGIVGEMAPYTGSAADKKGKTQTLTQFERRGVTVINNPGNGSRIGGACGKKSGSAANDSSINIVQNSGNGELTINCSDDAQDIYAGLLFGEYASYAGTTPAIGNSVFNVSVFAPSSSNLTGAGLVIGLLSSGSVQLGGKTAVTIRPTNFKDDNIASGTTPTETLLVGAKADGTTVTLTNVVIKK